MLGNGYGSNPRLAPFNPTRPANGLPGGGGGMFNISTGIQAGPIWNQQRVDQATHQLGNPAMRMPMPNMGNASSALGEQFAGLMQQGGQQNALNFGRQASLGNAQHQLRSQTARAGTGVDWANLLAHQYGTNLGSQAFLNNALMNLLKGFV